MSFIYYHIVDCHSDVVTYDRQVLLEYEVLELLYHLALAGFEDVLNNPPIEPAVLIAQVGHHVQHLGRHLECMLVLFFLELWKHLPNEDPC